MRFDRIVLNTSVHGVHTGLHGVFNCVGIEEVVILGVERNEVKDRIIRVLDYTAQNVNSDVVDAIEDALKVEGGNIVDFKGTMILDLVHERIAELIVDHGVIVVNVPDEEDRELIEYFKRALMRPQVKDLDTFREVFKLRFTEGTVCVLDQTVDVGTGGNFSIVMIESIQDDRVLVRKYFQSKSQPYYFKKYGGPDSKELYTLEEFDMVDLYNNKIVIDHPRSTHEKRIIDALFKSS